MLILITKDIFNEQEVRLLRKFLELPVVFHIRKPLASENEISCLLKMLPLEYFMKITLHGFFPLAEKFPFGGVHVPVNQRRDFFNFFSKYPELLKNKRISFSVHSDDFEMEYPQNTDYVLVGPIWDSISKKGYKGIRIFPEETAVPSQIKKIAVGGVSEGNIKNAFSWGYHGVAVCGAVWESDNPEHAFERIYRTYRDVVGNSAQA